MASVNTFDKTCRAAAKLNAQAFLRWLLGGWLTFRSWLDTRMLSYPGQPDRTCDTVAHLTEPSGQPWAMPVEFQLQPDADMCARLLCYLGLLSMACHPDPEPGSRFHLAAVLLNLTGQGNSSRRMRLRLRRQGRQIVVLETTLQVHEVNLQNESAERTLRSIARGRTDRCILVWIPLMHGAEDPAVIKEWRRLAEKETDPKRRSDYGAFTLVLAEAAGRQEIWKTGLEGWNMRESQQVLEWQKEGQILNCREILKNLLEANFGPLPESWQQRLENAQDLDRLKAACLQVLRLKRLDDLVL